MNLEKQIKGDIVEKNNHNSGRVMVGMKNGPNPQ